MTSFAPAIAGAGIASALLRRFTKTWLASGQRHCEHLNGPQRDLAWLCSAHPATLRCGLCHCDHIAGHDLSDPWELTCENCGSRDNQTIHPLFAFGGPVAVVGGVCPRCYAAAMGAN